MHHLGGVGDNLVALRVHAVPELECATRLQLDALVLLGQRCLIPANQLISQNVLPFASSLLLSSLEVGGTHVY